MPDVGTVLLVDSDEKSREMVFANAVKLGEIPIGRSSCEEAKSLLAELKRQHDELPCRSRCLTFVGHVARLPSRSARIRTSRRGARSANSLRRWLAERTIQKGDV